MLKNNTMTLKEAQKSVDALDATGSPCDREMISDGFHTFKELYDHRIALFVALCGYLAIMGNEARPVWRSKLHADGSSYDGWFIMGICKEAGNQISYHLPLSYWDECEFAEELERSPKWDGHTPADVVERLKHV